MSQLNGAPETGAQTSPANSNAGEDAGEMPAYQPRPPRANRIGERDPFSPPSQQQQGRAKQQGKIDEPQHANSSEEPARVDLASLFDESGDPLPDEEDNDDSKPPSHLEHLQKRLGLTPEQVYAIKVPMPDGAESLTIGEIKDKVKDLVNLETRETQFEQRRIKSEGDLLRGQTELRELLAMLPQDAITKDMVDKVRKKHNAHLAVERQRTLNVIPEWDDEETRTKEVEGIVGFLSEHGFDEGFINTVVDHKALKFLRVMWQRDVRIKKALANVKDPAPKKGIRPSGKAPAPRKPGSTTPRSERVMPDQRSKIMALLNRS